MKTYYFEVEQYNNGEGYEGILMAIAKDMQKAMKKIIESYLYQKLQKYGGTITMKYISVEDVAERQRKWCKESCEVLGDHYN